MDGSVYPAKDVIKASRSAVLLYASREQKHGEGERQQGKDKVTTCNAQFGIRCEQHVGLFQATSSVFFDGTILMPTHIVCIICKACQGTGKSGDADCSECKAQGWIEVKREVGAMAAKEFIDFINLGVQKVGAGLGRDEYLFAKSKLEEGGKALEAGDLKTAWKAVDELKKNKAFKNQAAWLQKADDLGAKINEAGGTLVKKAQDAAAAGNVDDARKLLKEVIAGCGSLDCVKVAKEEMGKLPKQ